MNADAPNPPSDDETAWYEGMRGGQARSPAAAQGRRLREHLRAEALTNTPPKAPPRPWAELQAEYEARQATGPAEPPLSDNVVSTASNDPWWRHGRPWAVAALVAVVCSLQMWRSQHSLDSEGMTSRGGGSLPSSAVMQRWRHAEPAIAAQQLAEQLRRDGAEVSVANVAGTIHLKVKAAQPHLDAVTATLAALEMSLDGKGQADIQIEAGP